jgi:hypothetical protein
MLNAKMLNNDEVAHYQQTKSNNNSNIENEDIIRPIARRLSTNEIDLNLITESLSNVIKLLNIKLL